MKSLFIIVFLLSLLSGCSLLPTREVIVNRDVLVTVPCKINPPVKPVMPLTDTGDTKDNIFINIKKAIAEIEIRKGYELQLETAVKSCL